MERIVCFAGHQTLTDDELSRLWKALDAEIERQIQNDAVIFRTGGARGFDTAAALCVVSHRIRYPHIRLELILPAPQQTRGWSDSDILTYQQILGWADDHRYIAPNYYSGILRERSRSLVAEANTCIAYLRPPYDGGVAYTASLALKKHIPLINLYERI